MVTIEPPASFAHAVELFGLRLHTHYKSSFTDLYLSYLGVLLNNEYVINKEEYDLAEVHAKVTI